MRTYKMYCFFCDCYRTFVDGCCLTCGTRSS